MFRALVLVLVLAFAAGTVAHAAQASGMEAKMSAAAAVDGTMPDCDGCGGDDGKLACSLTCVAPAIAILGSEMTVPASAAAHPPLPPAGEVGDRPTLVDPYPPRRHVLI